MAVIIQLIQISSTVIACLNIIAVIVYLSLASFRTDSLQFCYIFLTVLQPTVNYFIYLYRLLSQIFSHHRDFNNKLRLLIAGNGLILIYMILAEFKLLYTQLARITELEARWMYFDKWEKFVMNTSMPIMIHIVFQALPQAVVALTNHDVEYFGLEVMILVTTCTLWVTGMASVLAYIVSKRNWVI